MKRFIRRLILLLGFVAAATAALVMIYRQRIRPWHTTWGATLEETTQDMPGDDIVQGANFQTTRAVTIAAPPRQVWPWLIQLGQGRGGFYSYDLLENISGLKIHSANRIESQYQNLAVGDTVPVEPEGSGFAVKQIEPNKLLLLTMDGDGVGAVPEHFKQIDAASSWTFQLNELSGNRTRLVVRWRARYPTSGTTDPSTRLIGTALEPVEFIMERKMLQGIRERAEVRSKPSLIDDYLPDYDFSDIRTVSIDATAQEVFEAALGLKAKEISTLVEKAIESSDLPDKLSEVQDAVASASDVPILELLNKLILTPLAQKPNEEIVVGLVGEFWDKESPAMDWPRFDSPEEFVAFDDPAYGKLVSNLLILPGREPDSVLLTSEIRTQILDPDNREKLSRYWSMVSGGSGVVRQQWLKAIKRKAEGKTTA